MLAVGLALVSALLFGAMTVALRIAVKRTGEVELGAAAILLAALTVSLFALAAEALRHGVAMTDVWPFALAGISRRVPRRFSSRWRCAKSALRGPRYS